jgi:hypothetical protein
LVKRLPAVVLGSWTALTFALTFARGGLSADNVTHIALIGFTGLQLLLLGPLRRLAARCRPGAFFIVASVVCALIAEGCYMISAPLHPSLIVTRSTGAAAALRNYGVDVLLVTPAYVIIFSLVWWLARRHAYETWEYALFIPAGHALGDGNTFFVANPALLLLLPYVMINYQAMSLAAYLAVRPGLPARSTSRWRRYLLPLVLLPICYFVCGSLVFFVGHRLGFF